MDAMWRKLTGRASLPPLWLRRHAGPVGKFESAAREMTATIVQLGLVREGDCVLDLGCGASAMVPSLARLIGATGSYVGIDRHAPSIAWARRRFSPEARLRFERAEEGQQLPLDEAGCGFILAKSLFTHLLESEARRYLTEIRRVLAPGRAALVTAFLFEKQSRTGRGQSSFFRAAGPSGLVRMRSAARPRSAVAYERGLFLSMLAAAGLAIGVEIPGFCPGDADPPAGQDVLILGRR